MWNFESLESDEALLAEREKRAKQKRDNERRRKLARIPFIRFDSQLRILSDNPMGGVTLPARVFLHDFKQLSVRFFSPKFLDNTLVELQVPGDKPVTIKGRVVWCTSVPVSPRIVTEVKYAFRAEIIFAFESDGRRERIENVSEDLIRRYQAPADAIDWPQAA